MMRICSIVFAVVTVSLASTFAQSIQTSEPYAPSITPTILEKHSAAYSMYESGPSIEDRIAQRLNYDALHGEYIIIRDIKDEPEPGSVRKPTRLERIDASFANADIVVTGTPVRRVSALTSGHEFAFSDYEVIVNSVLSNRLQPLAQGSTVVLTRAGGVVTVGEAKVRAIDPEFQLLRLKEQYVFFLHYDDQTHAFRIGPSDAYLISGNTVIASKKQSKLLPESSSTSEFLNDLYSAAQKRGNR